MGHREDLLAGARQCLLEKGYARTTARDLVNASNTNLASIGYHFDSKEDLLNIALLEVFTEWGEKIQEIALKAKGDSALKRLGKALDYFGDDWDENRPYFVAFIEVLSQAEHADELRSKIAEKYDLIRKAMASLISEAVDDRRKPKDFETISSLLIAVNDGLLIQWTLDPDSIMSGKEFVSGMKRLVELLETS